MLSNVLVPYAPYISHYMSPMHPPSPMSRRGKCDFVKGMWRDRISRSGVLSNITVGRLSLEEQFPLRLRGSAIFSSIPLPTQSDSTQPSRPTFLLLLSLITSQCMFSW